MSTQTDFFICHASEDKQSFVRPFANYLLKNGATLFYDEFSIRLGDSLSETINRGLSVSKVAIVVLSRYFFDKPWTNAELQGIFQRHIAKKTKLIIIYHEISHDEVLERLPLLSDIYAADSSVGIPQLTKLIFEACEFRSDLKYISSEVGQSFSRISEEGFFFSVFFSLNTLFDPFIEKYVIEFGDESKPFGRVSARIKDNKIILVEVIDSDGRAISLRTDATPFMQDSHMLTFQLAPSRGVVELYVDATVVSRKSEVSPDFFRHCSITGKFLLFNSLDLVHPCPATVSMYYTGKELSEDQVRSLFERSAQLLSSLR